MIGLSLRSPCCTHRRSSHPDVTRASELLRTKAMSSVELTRACLARIERFNGPLDAFITVTADQALAMAHDMDAALRRGEWRGPLHGVPIALKDNVDTAGIRTTAASELFKDRVPTDDADIVVRSKRAGGLCSARPIFTSFAYRWQFVGQLLRAGAQPMGPRSRAGRIVRRFGRCRCRGLVFRRVRHRTAGSVRMPAAYCGIVGLKPTYGRVSNRGVIPLSWTLDHVGPLCKTVDDRRAL